MATAKRKGIVISLGGTPCPVHLVDGTQVVVKIGQGTTAGAVILAVRRELKLERDVHYSLFEHYEDHFRILDDATQLSKLLAKWPQDSTFGGPRRLFFRRALFIPGSATDNDEKSGASPECGPFRVAYGDCVFQFQHGTYRFDTSLVLKLAALIVYGSRGPWTHADSLLRLKELISGLLPTYVNKDAGREHPCSHGVGKVEDALTAEDASKRVMDEYKALGSHMSRFEAQKHVLNLCREHPCYGYEFFYGRRTWKDAEPHADGTTKEIARSEEVVLCAGHEGLYYLHMDDPLAIVTHEYGDITRWSVSRDGKIFAFSLEDGTLVYIVTDMAPYIERTVEKYVEEKVAAMRAAEGEGGDPDKSVQPRPDAFGTVPPVVRTVPPPLPSYAMVPWPFPIGADPADEFDPSVLPEGWLALTDADGDKYYFETRTQRTSWSHPLVPKWPLPVGWNESTDPQSGEAYYWHDERPEEAVWERPLPDPIDVEPVDSYLLPEWSVAADQDGDPYYFHAASGESTWTKPRDPNAPSLTARWENVTARAEAKLAAKGKSKPSR